MAAPSQQFARYKACHKISNASSIANDVRRRKSDDTRGTHCFRSRFAGGAAVSHRPRLLICGRGGLGQTTHVAPAVLHLLEHLPLHRMDLPSLHAVTARAPEEACAQVRLQEVFSLLQDSFT